TSRRRHTRSKRDWSSDVCSSDLDPASCLGFYHYGIHVGRNGMACCPFHNDKTPSMKLDQRYHCFGCGADGDVIDFAAALYGLGKKEAAVQLAQDFGLSYEDWKPPGKAKKPKPRQKSPE